MNSIGKTITEVYISPSLDTESLVIKFDDDTLLRLTDDGQSCCESRYMSADGEDLSYYVGAQFLGWQIKDYSYEEEKYSVHEIEFLEISTSKGSFTISSHNEHNGYYGGFAINAYEE